MPMEIYNSDERIRLLIDRLTDGTYERLSGNFSLIRDSVLHSDEYFVLKDFHAYVDAWKELNKLHSNADKWTVMSIVNTAKSWYFSSDRTIREYAQDIWGL